MNPNAKPIYDRIAGPRFATGTAALLHVGVGRLRPVFTKNGFGQCYVFTKIATIVYNPLLIAIGIP